MDNMETATIRSGALSFVLKIARVTGAAPVSFKVLRDGYMIISVSRIQQVYCFFVLTVYNIFGFYGIYNKTRYLKETLNVPQSHIRKFFELFQYVSCVVASTVGYMGYYRMKNMIHQLNILEKIKSKISYDYNAVTLKHDNNVKWASVSIILMYTVAILTDTVLSVLRASVYDISELLGDVHYVCYVILLLIKIKIAVMNFEVYKVLLELNEKLRYLLALAVRENIPINAKTRMVNNEIRRLTQCYVSICKVVKKIYETDGLYMLLIYICFIIFGVFVGYDLVVVLTGPTDLSYRWVDIIIKHSWCIIVVARTTFFVEPFHRISFQVAEMKVLLTKLTLQMTPLGTPVSLELDVMIKQVILNVPKYSLLGILTLNRSLLTTTFSAIVTYLVFVIQIE